MGECLGCAFCKHRDLSVIYRVYVCKKHHTLVSFNDRGCNEFDKE